MRMGLPVRSPKKLGVRHSVRLSRHLFGSVMVARADGAWAPNSFCRFCWTLG